MFVLLETNKRLLQHRNNNTTRQDCSNVERVESTLCRFSKFVQIMEKLKFQIRINVQGENRNNLKFKCFIQFLVYVFQNEQTIFGRVSRKDRNYKNENIKRAKFTAKRRAHKSFGNGGEFFRV